MCATMGQGKLYNSYNIRLTSTAFANSIVIFVVVVSRIQINSGNVVGSAPYEVGQPACSSFGMTPSSRYLGLCVTTSTVYTPTNDIITQNTYTFKSERINPIVYKTIDEINSINTINSNAISSNTYNTNAVSPVNTYNAYAFVTTPPTPPPAPVSIQVSPAEVYQRALQAYQNPNQSYESAQRNYQIALQAYAAAYPSSAATQNSQSTNGYYTTSVRRTSNPYDWSAYY